MAGSIINNLTPKQRQFLADWYGTEPYLALKALLEQERLNTATKLLDVAPDDVATIGRHQGRADMCKQLHLTLKNNHDILNKQS